MKTKRTGFTLVELLVVAAIIATLAALGIAVFGAGLSTARKSQTRTTLLRLQSLQNAQAQRWQRLNMRTDAYRAEQQEYIYGIFPTAAGSVQQILAQKAANRAHLLPLDTFDDPDALDSDAWGNPIRQYLWPTRLWHSGGAGAAITAADMNRAKLVLGGFTFTGNLAKDLLKDPDDPLGQCNSVANFEKYLHTPGTFHCVILVSAGPDGRLGIYEPSDFANLGHLAQVIPGADEDLMDNLWSIGGLNR